MCTQGVDSLSIIVMKRPTDPFFAIRHYHQPSVSTLLFYVARTNYLQTRKVSESSHRLFQPVRLSSESVLGQRSKLFQYLFLSWFCTGVKGGISSFPRRCPHYPCIDESNRGLSKQPSNASYRFRVHSATIDESVWKCSARPARGDPASTLRIFCADANASPGGPMLSIQFDLDRRASRGTFIFPASRAR